MSDEPQSVSHATSDDPPRGRWWVAMTGHGESTLLIEPALRGGRAGGCVDHLADADRSTSVLSVLYGEPIAERMTTLRRHADRIDSAAIVCVGPAGDPAETERRRESVRVVSDPADLTGVGIAVTEWLDARSGTESAAICLDSLSTLLQYADEERAFRFLHAVASQCRQRGTDFHAHLTPDAHDERTVAKFRQLFDRRVDRRGAGVDTAAGARQVATDGGRQER